MTIHLIFFLAGIGLLCLSSEMVVRKIPVIARRLGISCIIRPLVIADACVLNIDIASLILAGVMMQIFITTKAIFSRIEAVAVLLLYAYFVATHLWPRIVPWCF
ncbi:MAG: hypothetical protein JW913_15265 [Chitinispirillaceae bacterium]|nr:hypothetical protein [Chitinispirillaceae bacterium]